jgi:hypothetical protein
MGVLRLRVCWPSVGTRHALSLHKGWAGHKKERSDARPGMSLLSFKKLILRDLHQNQIWIVFAIFVND